MGTTKRQWRLRLTYFTGLIIVNTVFTLSSQEAIARSGPQFEILLGDQNGNQTSDSVNQIRDRFFSRQDGALPRLVFSNVDINSDIETPISQSSDGTQQEVRLYYGESLYSRIRTSPNTDWMNGSLNAKIEFAEGSPTFGEFKVIEKFTTAESREFEFSTVPPSPKQADKDVRLKATVTNKNGQIATGYLLIHLKSPLQVFQDSGNAAELAGKYSVTPHYKLSSAGTCGEPTQFSIWKCEGSCHVGIESNQPLGAISQVDGDHFTFTPSKKNVSDVRSVTLTIADDSTPKPREALLDITVNCPEPKPTQYKPGPAYFVGVYCPFDFSSGSDGSHELPSKIIDDPIDGTLDALQAQIGRRFTEVRYLTMGCAMKHRGAVSGEELLRNLELFPKNDPNAEIFLYVTGHGSDFRSKSGADLNLIALNYDKQAEGRFPAGDLLQALASLNSKRVHGFFQTCDSGAALSGIIHSSQGENNKTLPARITLGHALPKNFYLYSSVQEGVLSYNNNNFGSNVISGLMGGADGQSQESATGWVTPCKLRSYLENSPHSISDGSDPETNKQTPDFLFNREDSCTEAPVYGDYSDDQGKPIKPFKLLDRPELISLSDPKFKKNIQTINLHSARLYAKNHPGGTSLRLQAQVVLKPQTGESYYICPNATHPGMHNVLRESQPGGLTGCGIGDWATLNSSVNSSTPDVPLDEVISRSFSLDRLEANKTNSIYIYLRVIGFKEGPHQVSRGSAIVEVRGYSKGHPSDFSTFIGASEGGR